MALSDKEQKLLRLALDAAAQPGEADNAAVALIRSMRARGADAYDRREFKISSPPKADLKPADWPGCILMPFGKHAGQPLAQLPPDYLRWCLSTFDDNRAELKKAMRLLLDELNRRWQQPNF